MRNADTILGVIRDRGRRRLPLHGISRPRYNRPLYLQASGRLDRNAGAMTPGATSETVDAMSLEKIEAIIDALRPERYRWPPVRRVCIEKQHSMQTRPVGLPTWADKLRQEVIRTMLEADDAPPCSPHAHGFRPGRGCHTALGELTTRWRGVTWCIEGAISQCFDSLDHQVLLSILREPCQDQRCLRLIAHLLQAGDLEDWRFHATLSGVPQGGVVSPLLSNLYLDRLEQCVAMVLLPAYHRGDCRRPDPPYMARLNAARQHRMAGRSDEAKALRHQAQRLPSRDPNDPHCRRLWYVRYADDWRLGCSGPRHEADAIKGPLSEFLREPLQLTLSQDNTLLTNARMEAARLLGDEIVTQHADDQQSRALRRRSINGAPGLKVPVHVIRAQGATDLRRGKPLHLPARRHEAAYSLVAQYQAADRGFVQYSLLAYNVHRLWRGHRVRPRSLVTTLADTHRTSVKKVYRPYRTTVPTPQGTLTGLEVRHARGHGQPPLVARFGGIELRWQRQAILNDHPKEVCGRRREVVQRLLAQVCERCGAKDTCEVHHLRKLADLNRPGRRAKPLWGRRMAARQRKTLVVCRLCHEDIHRERPSRRKVTA